AVGNQTVTRRTFASGEIVPDDPVIVEGHMRELRTAGAFTDRPNRGRRGLQALVDLDITALVQFNATHFKTNARRLRAAADSHQDVTTLQAPLPRRCPDGKRDLASGTPLHAQGIGLHNDVDAFFAEDPSDFVGNIAIFLTDNLQAALEDGHTAPESPEGL